MSSFAIYLIGTIVVVGGLVYGAYLTGLATQWIVVGAVVLVGIGIVTAVSSTKRRDPPAE